MCPRSGFVGWVVQRSCQGESKHKLRAWLVSISIRVACRAGIACGCQMVMNDWRWRRDMDWLDQIGVLWFTLGCLGPSCGTWWLEGATTLAGNKTMSERSRYRRRMLGSAGTLPMDGLKGFRVRFGDIVTQGVSDPLFLSLGWEICCLHTSYDITSTIYSCSFGNGEVGILPVCKLCVPWLASEMILLCYKIIYAFHRCRVVIKHSLLSGICC